jgi:ABC-type transport system involved in multi-copper enzyme maturation permease subunit
MPIFDQGYQHWTGTLAGHRWRWLAVARHGVRTLRKSWVVRVMVFVAWLPALALVAALTLWGLLEQQLAGVVEFLQRIFPPDVVASPREFRSAVWTVAYSYFFKAELVCAVFLVLTVGPSLVSRDLRFNALPLYLSRPVRRVDYFAGKLGVIAYFLLATLIAPGVAAYLLGLAFSLDLGVVADTHRVLWASLGYGLVVVLSAGTLMLALSSLSRRSVYVGLAWAGLILLGHTVSSILVSVGAEADRREIVQTGIKQWVEKNPPPPGVEMSGPYPMGRFSRSGGPEKEKPQTPDEKARERWMNDWNRAYNGLQYDVDTRQAERSRTDWRPLLSYTNNLDRMGDWLLDTDSAWLTLGRAIERPQAMAAPLARTQGVELSSAPVNDRRLADRLTWQYPWYWSAAVLGGVWLVSVLILTRRVKSLDRLK